MGTRLRALLTALFCVALLGLLAGCKSPCRQLSELLCECETNQWEREACIRQAASRESQVDPTDADQEYCAGLVDKCDCRLIDTEEGKRDCGLIR
jgi:hypothetical protein